MRKQYRVFYDVEGSAVQILTIVLKDAVDEWLRKVAISDEEGSTT
jgi:hypothetical protein